MYNAIWLLRRTFYNASVHTFLFRNMRVNQPTWTDGMLGAGHRPDVVDGMSKALNAVRTNRLSMSLTWRTLVLEGPDEGDKDYWLESVPTLAASSDTTNGVPMQLALHLVPIHAGGGELRGGQYIGCLNSAILTAHKADGEVDLTSSIVTTLLTAMAARYKANGHIWATGDADDPAFIPCVHHASTNEWLDVDHYIARPYLMNKNRRRKPWWYVHEPEITPPGTNPLFGTTGVI